MIIGIQALNIRYGGGLVHLQELIKASDPIKHGYKKIIIWIDESVRTEFEGINNYVTIVPVRNARNMVRRFFWLKFVFPKEVLQCDVLFIPGGVTGAAISLPTVSMSQNLLLFEKIERERYGVSVARLRLELLRYLQKKEFANVSHVIALTNYARDIIHTDVGISLKKMSVVAHGIERHLLLAPRQQKALSLFSEKQPFKILYVSAVKAYKHQTMVIDAISKLKADGYPVSLMLTGDGDKAYLDKMHRKILSVDKAGKYIHYSGIVAHKKIVDYYHSHDLFLYASSCENLPIILLEAMAAGVPIACSDRGPMPEILGEAGQYFDPENCESIAKAAVLLIESPSLREKYAASAYKRALTYSWEKCANETFQIITDVYESYEQGCK